MEQRVQKALNFLKNPKVSSMTYDKKIEFLKSKLTPAEMEEVLKRSGDSGDFNKFFEPAPASEQQSSSKWNLKIISTVGAIIIGAIASAFFSSRNSKSDEIQEMQFKELLETIKEQKGLVENLNRQVAEIQFNLETIKRNQEELSIKLQEKKEEPAVEQANLIEEEKEQVNVDEIFANCFGGFSDSNKGLALKTMKMWFSNILTNPNDKQKSKINITNPQYKNYFAGNSQADRLFEAVGFVAKGSFLEFEATDLTVLRLMLDKITEGISSLPLQIFSNSAPWQLAKPVEKKPQATEELKAEDDKKLEDEGSKADNLKTDA